MAAVLFNPIFPATDVWTVEYEVGTNLPCWSIFGGYLSLIIEILQWGGGGGGGGVVSRTPGRWRREK